MIKGFKHTVGGYLSKLKSIEMELMNRSKLKQFQNMQAA